MPRPQNTATLNEHHPDVIRIAKEAEIQARTVLAYLLGLWKTNRGSKKLIREAAERLGLTHLLPTTPNTDA